MALPEANDFFGWVAYILNEYGSMLLSGAWKTMVIAVISTAIGCVIGFAVGIVQTIPTNRQENPVHWAVVGFFKALLNAYVEIFRGTPMMVQAAFIYYGAAMLFDIHMGTWTAALFIVSINTGAYMAETVRGGILSIDPGQTEGAKAIGMTHVQTMTNVILPQALRNILPQIGNNFIINIKDTSVMFIIGFIEFFGQHRNIVGNNNMFFQSAAIEMIGYLCMTLTASFLLRWMERRMDGSSNYELVKTRTRVLAAGTYRHPQKGTPFDERNKEYEKHMREAKRDRNLDKRGDR